MMLGLVLGAVLATTPLTPEGLELEATRYVRARSTKGARAAPVVDELLTRAARRLARQSLASFDAQAPDLLRAAEAVSQEGGAELITFTVAVRSGVPSHALELLQEKQASGAAASLLGVGVAAEEGNVALVVLTGERWVKLKPFPRAYSVPGKGDILCGELLRDLGVPAIHITRPDGTVDRARLASHEGRSFCAGLAFPQAGTHTVTVGAGRGATVNLAGTFRVRVGEAPAEVEPEDREVALQSLVQRINALRGGEGLEGVRRDAVLDRVAQVYADRMTREGFYGPKAPDGTTLLERIPEYGGKWGHAGENLGWGAGPLAAHFGIEHTVQARRNLLDPEARHVGLGLAWRKGEEGGREALIVEVLARRSPGALPAGGPVEETYRLLERLRTKQLPALHRSPELAELAAELAGSARGPGEVTDVAVYERIQKALPGATAASAAVYEVPDVLGLPRPAVLLDRATSDVGVAVVGPGAATGGGTPLYRVVVVCASRNQAEEIIRKSPSWMMGRGGRVN
jgi:uncharacterized protein YkwD